MSNLKIPFKEANIYLPNNNTDLSKWAVVACDQYTSEPEYWNKAKEYIGESPSCLNLILPEIYLEDNNVEELILDINKNMSKYLSNQVLKSTEKGFILVKRICSDGKTRCGLIGCVDLEAYNFKKGSNSLIRATEGTVEDRLPPRVKIRENAPLELPHIMLLIDDEKRTVIEPLINKLSDFNLLYNFDLMMNSGHIEGRHIKDIKDITQINNALTTLCDKTNFKNKYNLNEDLDVLLFAAGDGNHSLATAKVHWENIKSNLTADDTINHPARYALVEIVNIHDEGLFFEPIHRVLFNVDIADLTQKMNNYFTINSCSEISSNHLLDEYHKLNSSNNENYFQTLFMSSENINTKITIKNPPKNLTVGSLQAFIDSYISLHPSVKVDYIHGEDVTIKLGQKKGNIGFLVPSMKKQELFKTVILDGTLPRKTFSMGEASDKRFYIECRKIK